MQMFQKTWLTHLLLLFVVLALAVSFTAVAQAGGEGDAAPPAEEGASMGPPMKGGPPMGKPPGGKMVMHPPELANCIGAVAFYDGNLDGIVDANEDAMDGASIVLMMEAGPPPEDPPIGPDGNEITMEMPEMGPPHGGNMPMSKPPMGPPPAAEKPMGPPMKDGPPMGPPMKDGPPMGPPMKDGPPMGPPPAAEKPMGKPPMGPAMPEKQMPVKPTPQYVVVDRQITRDGGSVLFCDLKPGTYILQGDALEGITYGDTRQYTILKEDGYQLLFFGFKAIE